MKNHWMQFFYGCARMRIDGPYGERFLNRCIEHDIFIWNIKRVGKERIICYIALEDIKKVRPILKVTGCKVTFTERKGLPFWIKKLKTRSGFTIGMVSFLTILLILSNIVWNVKIEGASPKVEYELMQEIDELGIERGKFLFLLPNVEDIQKQITDSIDEATWIGVRLNGTTFHFEVVEQTLPEEKARINPRHLVAKKKAIIHDIFVEHGQALVKPNDFVNKGDLLVSGFIGQEGRTEIVPAQGKVFGEIWYKSDVSVPLLNIFETLTGESKKTYYLSFFNFDVPIWGFGKHTFDQSELFEKKYSFNLLNWQLPVQYKRKQWHEKEEVTREYEQEEAIQVALLMAREELVKKLPKDAEIKGEKVLHEAIDNGKVELKIHYQVIEEITTEQPIIQGD